MYLLVCNAGSTSLKFKLFEMPAEKVLAEAKVERIGRRNNGIFSLKLDMNFDYLFRSSYMPV